MKEPLAPLSPRRFVVIIAVMHSPASAVVLRGGRVVDPLRQLDTIADVVVVDGRVTAIGRHVGDRVTDAHPRADIVDCTGLLVTPGFIDLHVHVMEGLGDFCVGADDVGVEMGVPVVVDGGTSGVSTFDLARTAVIDHPHRAPRCSRSWTPTSCTWPPAISSATGCTSRTTRPTSIPRHSRLRWHAMPTWWWG
ncbi:MAG: hypothetical protein R2713_19425 [Ilumatobacteraceae bacterium]